MIYHIHFIQVNLVAAAKDITKNRKKKLKKPKNKIDSLNPNIRNLKKTPKTISGIHSTITGKYQRHEIKILSLVVIIKT